MRYIVSGFLYRNATFKDEELISINKEFKNENIIVARKEAFSYFRSVIEVLLESKGIEFTSFKNEKKELTDFYNSGVITRHSKLSHVSYDNDVDKLITISFTTDDNPYITKTGIKIYDNEYVIKATGYQSEFLNSSIKKNLEIEGQILKL